MGDLPDPPNLKTGIDSSYLEKIPRKGGPAITRSDLLVVNKTDLAPHVGADLAVMREDTETARAGRPFVFSDMQRREGLDEVIGFLAQMGGLERTA